jgi:hypothetical protein
MCAKEHPSVVTHWCHLSLRWWLLLAVILVTVIAVLCAISSPAWKQHLAVMRIEGYWGRVTYKRGDAAPAFHGMFQSFFGHITCVRCAPGTRCDLRTLEPLKEIEQLELTGGRVDVAEFATLNSLPRLWTLNLRATNITDADLPALGRLSRLKWLDLGNTQITDSGIEHLKSLNNLTLLFIGGTRVSEKGKRSLQLALPDCRIE